MVGRRPDARPPRPVGIGIQAIGFAIVWMNHDWTRSPSIARIVPAIVFDLGGVLSWTSARTLGRQWRFDAGLNTDHQLVKSGAYRFIRHPIYASMLCMLLGTGLLITPVAFTAGARFFCIGVRSGSASRMDCSRRGFGEEFRSYQRRVPAYVPFIR